MSAALKVENLNVTLTYRKASKKLVEDVSFEVHPGECLGILGESGSGKSMTVKSILGLLDKNFQVSGSAIFDGQDLLKETKEELRRLDSLILACADATRVEAGGALAVDREGFSKLVTEKIRSHPNITVVPGEVTAIPEGNVIIASGPLTSDALAAAIAEKLGEGHTLNFFDAAAPLVTFESIDMESAFFASRYDKGTADYINCPMTEEEYDAFWQALTTAEEASVHGFEDKNVFEGCMPVEVMARRGHDTLCYGPLKPRGLRDPKTGQEPYAVVQLLSLIHI